MLKIKMLCVAIATIALSSFCAHAAEREYDVKLPVFSAVTVGNDFKVTVKKGMNYSVTLYVEEAMHDYVQCGVSGTTLNIAVDTKRIPAEIKKVFRGKGNEPSYRAEVTLPGKLQALELSQNAEVALEDAIIDESVMRMVLTDNSVVLPVEFECDNVDVKMDKKSAAELTIDCENITVELSGSANLNLTQKSKTASIQQGVNSNLLFNGTAETLDYTSKAASKAVLNGTVPVVNFTISGSSSVNAANLVVDDAFVEMNSICSLVEAASKNLHVNISNGASLKFRNEPVFHIKSVKMSSLVNYEDKADSH